MAIIPSRNEMSKFFDHHPILGTVFFVAGAFTVFETVCVEIVVHAVHALNLSKHTYENQNKAKYIGNSKKSVIFE